MEGKIFFFLSKTYYKNQRMSGYQFFAVECLAEVVVEKNKPFYCNPFRPVWSVVKTKVESGQTQVKMP